MGLLFCVGCEAASKSHDSLGVGITYSEAGDVSLCLLEVSLQLFDSLLRLLKAAFLNQNKKWRRKDKGGGERRRKEKGEEEGEGGRRKQKTPRGVGGAKQKRVS